MTKLAQLQANTRSRVQGQVRSEPGDVDLSHLQAAG